MDWSKIWAEISSWNWTVLGGIIAFLALLVAYAGVRANHKENNRNKRNARKNLYRAAQVAIKNLTNPLLPYITNREGEDVIPKIKDFFYKKVRITNALSKKQLDFSKIKGAFILYGESGCGKTAIIRELLIRTLRFKKFIPSTGILIFEQSSTPIPVVGTPEYQQLLSQVKSAEFRRVYIYIDGIDEQVTPLQLKEVRSFVNSLSTYTKKTNLRISTRSIMLEEVRAAFGELKCYKIERWTEAVLVDFIKETIHLIEQKTKRQHKETLEYFTNSINYIDLEYSPLLCKLLLYNMLVDSSYKPGKNPFDIYKSFIRNVQACSRLEEVNYSDMEVNDFASIIYNQYYQGNLVCYLDDNKLYSSILKKTGNGKYTFIHQSFYEFFVALFFQSCFRNVSRETARVFTIDYLNSFADFISNSLTNYNTDNVVQVIIELYYYTLKESERKKYSDVFNVKSYSEIESYTIKLSKEKFITLKFMLVNRAGRLDPFNEKARRFVSYIYSNDDCVTPNGITLSDDELCYYRAVLKRCCAISASFLALVEIEVDFIRKMTGIVDEKEYDYHFDLANRSHTLLYYGDYPFSTNSEFNFRDRPSYYCYKACRKRMHHLKGINEKITLTGMNKKELRLHRFRLFDIATLYCFSRSRLDYGYEPRKMMGITDDDCQLLRSFRSSFDGDVPERATLIETLRNKTIDLLLQSPS